MSLYGRKVNLILKRMQKGDQAAFKELYNYTFNHLKKIAYKYVVNKNDCEDVIISSFHRAYNYINSFNTDQDGFNWLCRIVQRTAYEFNNDNLVYSEFSEAYNKEYYDLENIMETKDVIDRELAKLPDRDRELIYLRFYECWTYEELKKKFNSPKSTLQKRVTSILKKIKKNLKE